MAEATLVGHVSRKRALSKRLLFLELQTQPLHEAAAAAVAAAIATGAASSGSSSAAQQQQGSVRKVVVKDACEGVGGASIARYALKLGDLVRVRGEEEGDAESGTLHAAHIEVVAAWRDMSDGAQWKSHEEVDAGQPDGAEPAEGAETAATRGHEPADLPVCRDWLNTTRCERKVCPHRHWSPDLKAERRAWVAQRRQSRLELAAAQGDPTDPHDKQSHEQRAPQFAKFLIATFGRSELSAGSGVFDVAGGRGNLSFELSAEGIPCCLVDERRQAEPDRKQRKRMRKQLRQQQQPAAAAAGEAAVVAADDAERAAADAEASGVLADLLDGSGDADDGVPGDDVASAVTAAATVAGSTTATLVGSAEAAEAPSSRLPFKHLRARFDAAFEAEQHALLASASALVGMHPDQATEPIVDVALRLGRPFAVVPCCVFAREFPRQLPDGTWVTTYAQLLDYLQAKAPGIRRTHLAFVGRNVVLYHYGAHPPPGCVECDADEEEEAAKPAAPAAPAAPVAPVASEEGNAADAASSAAQTGSTVSVVPQLYAACLGQLGQFGNQIFQFAFAVVYAELWGLALRTPVWVGTYAFSGDKERRCTAPPLPPAAERIVVADRVILAHLGWKRWAEGRAPLASLSRAAGGGGGLSGRALRKWCPQVNAAAIAASADERAIACVAMESVGACVARGGTLELWGFFQFDTAHFAPHRERLLRAFCPVAPLQCLVDAALARLRAEAAGGGGGGSGGGGGEGAAATTLVVVHVRCKQDTARLEAEGYNACKQCHAGDDSGWRRKTPPKEEQAAAAAAAAAGAEQKDGGGGVGGGGGGDVDEEEEEEEERAELPPGWRDEGVFWSAPIEWYATWLRRLWPTLTRPRLLLCADDATAALAALREFEPALLPQVLGALPGLRAAAHAGCTEQLTEGALEMLCDWHAMRAADVLATANSTFSFTAALLAQPSRPSPPGAPARFWRPDPAAQALVEYEPWDAPVLLNACAGAGPTGGTAFRNGKRRGSVEGE